MPRPPKDLIELISERTHRHIIRIFYVYGPLIGADIGRKLEELTRIRFKSTSSLTEALGRLQKENLIEKSNSLYTLTKKSNEKWLIKFLNLLVNEKIDRGKIIRKRKHYDIKFLKSISSSYIY